MDRNRTEKAPGHTILNSSRPDDQHTEGVAMIMSRKMERDSFRMETSWNETSQGQVQLKVQAIIEDVPAHDVLMLVGDLNTRPGSNNNGRGRTGDDASLKGHDF
ncbi:hypothetical protein ACROYT_G028080 [Oculina patagonica]